MIVFDMSNQTRVHSVLEPEGDCWRSQAGRKSLSEVRPCSLMGMASFCFWSLCFSLSTPAFHCTFQQLRNQIDQGELGSSGWRWDNHFTVQVSRPMQQPIHLYRFCKLKIISFPSSRLTCLSKTRLSSFAHEYIEVSSLVFSVLVCSARQTQPLDWTPSCLVLGIASFPLPQPSGLAIGVFQDSAIIASTCGCQKLFFDLPFWASGEM